LWKIEATIKKEDIDPQEIRKHLEQFGASSYYIDCGKWYIFHVFCPTQAERRDAKNILDILGAKYFVTETKTL
jgi:hypothetical protein